MNESTKVRPPTYFNRKVGDQFVFRGVIHRVVAIHRRGDDDNSEKSKGGTET